jgi:hypothetical protein
MGDKALNKALFDEMAVEAERWTAGPASFWTGNAARICGPAASLYRTSRSPSTTLTPA